MKGRRAGKIQKVAAKPQVILRHKKGQVFAPVSSIKVQRNFNVRGDTDPDNGLFKSIEEQGVQNPIHVRWRDNKEDTLYVVDGERRFKAAKKAKWSEVPVVCRGHIDDRDALVVSLTTNESQKPLTRAEKAEGFKRLRDAGLSEGEISAVMGCSERTVAETLRLVDKATKPIRKAAMSNGDSSIPVRAASRAATLPKETQKKLAPKMVGKTTEEALAEVRLAEEALEIKPKGATRTKQGKRGARTDPKSLVARLDNVERVVKKMAAKHPKSALRRAQLDIIDVLRGDKAVSYLLKPLSKKSKK